ncbi:cell division protein FtsA [uncultured Paenalcaligenes sp.]|uniref:cell division protein FtsA n=1 Tax=uncultured Paenalcaligenes sp. TaxID=1588925 RepID=UPI002623083E|nr:cell division protein FtsA [uncultured Paenalcaligenes sp.]
MARDNKDLIVALDIGTSKVVAVVAEVLPEGRFEVLGLGQHESMGMRKGVVVNIEATVNSIQRALEEAELMADCKIGGVYTGVSGSHIASLNSSGMVAIKDKEVTSADVSKVVEIAQAVNIPMDQQVLHVLEQEFFVDAQEEIKQPVGMSGFRLEVRVHIVTAASSAVQNIERCVRRCGSDVQELMLAPLASSMACLTDDEKELGVVLIDIGSGTTDIAIYTGGAIRHTHVIPIAGDQITSDIATMLRTPMPDAEEIKLRYGLAREANASPEELIEVTGLGDRPNRQVKRHELGAVIEPRVEELFQLVQHSLKESGYENLLASGVVITGGSALLPGIVELAEEVFSKQVRVAMPIYHGSLADMMRNPRFSTAMGLLSQARNEHGRGRKVAQQKGRVQTLLSRAKEWFMN